MDLSSIHSFKSMYIYDKEHEIHADIETSK